ncbi:Zn(2+)-responsive transcriptional regulator [Aliikangiella sp. G2MR2-5]|uniref:Zn(2+)-responsive transcriptional regulator n=1 Tax=Aliikangiella sp. G2MR2-5 TaxID=2788943 RepID=UPI001FEEF7AF|nr:Zn(2+)-responsive transcriptional regulator [Aliikangiella sp. G2MR2-5]
MVAMQTHYLKIGQLAARAGISVESLRYYESEGLISANCRSENGYRLYSDESIQKLGFILHAKKIGFSLKEIKRLLGLRLNRDQHTCEEVKDYTGAKIREIEQKIADLVKMKSALVSLHEACCGGNETADNCSILQTLEAPFTFEKIESGDS